MKYTSLIIALCLLMTQGCRLQRASDKMMMMQSAQPSVTQDFDLTIENNTVSNLYCCCFYYSKGTLTNRWNWHKSPVIALPPSEKSSLKFMVTSPSKENLHDIEGVLSVFKKKEKADMAIIELLPDEQKIYLGKLSALNQRVIRLVTEQYGFKGKTLNYNLTSTKTNENEPVVNFKFIVENNTAQNLYLTGFTYEAEASHPQWDFEKLPVVLFPKNTNAIITIPCDKNRYNIPNVNGYLAVYPENQKAEAERATYESLRPQNKIKLGALTKINNQKITLKTKKYGVLTDFNDNLSDIEFDIKPSRRYMHDDIWGNNRNISK